MSANKKDDMIASDAMKRLLAEKEELERLNKEMYTELEGARLFASLGDERT